LDKKLDGSMKKTLIAEAAQAKTLLASTKAAGPAAASASDGLVDKLLDDTATNQSEDSEDELQPLGGMAPTLTLVTASEGFQDFVQEAAEQAQDRLADAHTKFAEAKVDEAQRAVNAKKLARIKLLMAQADQSNREPPALARSQAAVHKADGIAKKKDMELPALDSSALTPMPAVEVPAEVQYADAHTKFAEAKVDEAQRAVNAKKLARIRLLMAQADQKYSEPPALARSQAAVHKADGIAKKQDMELPALDSSALTPMPAVEVPAEVQYQPAALTVAAKHTAVPKVAASRQGLQRQLYKGYKPEGDVAIVSAAGRRIAKKFMKNPAKTLQQMHEAQAAAKLAKASLLKANAMMKQAGLKAKQEAARTKALMEVKTKTKTRLEAQAVARQKAKAAAVARQRAKAAAVARQRAKAAAAVKLAQAVVMPPMSDTMPPTATKMPPLPAIPAQAIVLQDSPHRDPTVASQLRVLQDSPKQLAKQALTVASQSQLQGWASPPAQWAQPQALSAQSQTLPGSTSQPQPWVAQPQALSAQSQTLPGSTSQPQPWVAQPQALSAQSQTLPGPTSQPQPWVAQPQALSTQSQTSPTSHPQPWVAQPQAWSTPAQSRQWQSSPTLGLADVSPLYAEASGVQAGSSTLLQLQSAAEAAQKRAEAAVTQKYLARAENTRHPSQQGVARVAAADAAASDTLLAAKAAQEKFMMAKYGA